MNSLCETMELYRLHTAQVSEFVRWISAFQHVFVFTVKKRCDLFIGIVEYTCRYKYSCVKLYFPCLPGTVRHSLVLHSKHILFRYLY